MTKAEFDDAIAAARAAGASAELSRIRQILTAPEARGFEAAAIACAMEPTMSLEIARGILDQSDFAKGRNLAKSLKC